MSKTIKSISAGKGDKPRPTNLKKYRENYEEINWHRDDYSDILQTDRTRQEVLDIIDS